MTKFHDGGFIAPREDGVIPLLLPTHHSPFGEYQKDLIAGIGRSIGLPYEMIAAEQERANASYMRVRSETDSLKLTQMRSAFEPVVHVILDDVLNQALSRKPRTGDMVAMLDDINRVEPTPVAVRVARIAETRGRIFSEWKRNMTRLRNAK